MKFLARTFSGARKDFHRVKRADFRPKSGWEWIAREGSSQESLNSGRRLIAGGREHIALSRPAGEDWAAMGGQ